MITGKNKIIKILEKGDTKKYVITNNSDIKINTLNIISKNQCRWIINVKDITPKSYLIEIFTLENKIIETNNPMIQDIANFNNTFKEVYNELVLEVNYEGDLIAVKNLPDIRRKWLSIREQLKELSKDNQNATSVINLNDGLFNSDANVHEVIKAMEFFELFFIGFYGNVLPARNISKIRGSKFRGTKMEWLYNFNIENNNTTNQSIITMMGFPNRLFNEGFVKQAYGQFDFLNYSKIKANVKCEGEYFINNSTGMIDYAKYKNDEIIDEYMLYSKNNYTIETYN